MKASYLIAALMTVLVALPAAAIDLHSARAAGKVKELPTGYVEAASTSEDVVKLVNEVNAKRRTEYEKISKKNGQPIDVVGKLAAPEIAKSIAAGN